MMSGRGWEVAIWHFHYCYDCALYDIHEQNKPLNSIMIGLVLSLVMELVVEEQHCF